MHSESMIPFSFFFNKNATENLSFSFTKDQKES